MPTMAAATAISEITLRPIVASGEIANLGTDTKTAKVVTGAAPRPDSMTIGVNRRDKKQHARRRCVLRPLRYRIVNVSSMVIWTATGSPNRVPGANLHSFAAAIAC
jgi:hypothetical protein